jgi:hypothetical protein
MYCAHKLSQNRQSSITYQGSIRHNIKMEAAAIPPRSHRPRPLYIQGGALLKRDLTFP